MHVAQGPKHNEEGPKVKVCQNAGSLVLTSPAPVEEGNWWITAMMQWGVERLNQWEWPQTQHQYLGSAGRRWDVREMMSRQRASSVGTGLTTCNCERVPRGRGLCKVGMQGYIPMRSWELKAVCRERTAQWKTQSGEEEQRPIKDAEAEYGGAANINPITIYRLICAVLRWAAEWAGRGWGQ